MLLMSAATVRDGRGRSLSLIKHNASSQQEDQGEKMKFAPSECIKVASWYEVGVRRGYPAARFVSCFVMLPLWNGFSHYAGNMDEDFQGNQKVRRRSRLPFIFARGRF